MPQVDLETLFRVGSGRKIVCATLIDPAPDYPAESFRVPVEDEIDWVDRHAVVLDHSQSTKRVIPPKLTTNSSNSNSKRFKSKPFIIGLPKRPDSALLCSSSLRRSCRPPRIRYLPKSAETEPESPKVSCIGRIRSRKAKGSRRSGFWAKFVAVFVCDRKISGGGFVPESKSAKESSEKKVPTAAAVGPIPTVEAPVPGLGGMMKLASGRRSESWGQEVTDGHVA